MKVCKQIYRSIINFIEHKRHYCTDIYDYHLHYISQFVNNVYNTNTSSKAASNENASQSSKEAKNNKSGTNKKKMSKATASVSDENSMNSNDSFKSVGLNFEFLKGS